MDKYQIEYKMKTAREHEAQGKYLHALQLYRAIIEEVPEWSDAYFNLADIYEHLSNINAGVEMLEQFLEIDPADKERRLFLGQYLLRNSLWNNAIEVLSYFSPEEEPLAAFFLGYSYFMLNDFEIAKINFLTFIGSKQESDLRYEAFLYLVKIEVELENYDIALDFAKRAEPVYFDYWEFNYLVAKIYYKLGMIEHSIKPIEKSIQQNKKQAELFELAGKIYLKAGNYIKAEKKYLKFIEISTETTPEVYIELAQVCLKSDKARDALKYFEIAIQLDPKNRYALQGKKNAKSILNNNAVNDG